MALHPSALLPGSQILVTGANGYIAFSCRRPTAATGPSSAENHPRPQALAGRILCTEHGPNAFESVIVSSGDVDIVGRVMDGVDGIVHLVWLSWIDYLNGIEAKTGLNKGI